MEETADLINSKLENGDNLVIDGCSENDRQVFMNRLRILGFAKNIKFWSVLETIYNCFIGFFFFWPYLFCSILSFTGYYGSKNFNKKYISWYFGGELVKFVFKILVLIFIDSVVSKVITTIILIMSLVYLNTIWRFYTNLKAASEQDLHTLRNGWTPRIVYFVY